MKSIPLGNFIFRADLCSQQNQEEEGTEIPHVASDPTHSELLLFVTIDKPTLTHHNPSKSIVYIGIHS